MKELKSQFLEKKQKIKKRLTEFREVWNGTDKEIFAELCFCVCTPQSKAIYCDKAIKGLVKGNVLYKGALEDIRAGLKAVRFPNNKSRYIIKNRKLFTYKGKIRIKNKIDLKDVVQARNWIVKNVIGVGYKEASHFLRNIGQGEDLAILDVHILRNMVKYKIIKEVPKTITKKTYIELEGKLQSFADRLNMSMGELDLLLWSKQTGIIFK